MLNKILNKNDKADNGENSQDQGLALATEKEKSEGLESRRSEANSAANQENVITSIIAEGNNKSGFLDKIEAQRQKKELENAITNNSIEILKQKISQAKSIDELEKLINEYEGFLSKWHDKVILLDDKKKIEEFLAIKAALEQLKEMVKDPNVINSLDAQKINKSIEQSLALKQTSIAEQAVKILSLNNSLNLIHNSIAGQLSILSNQLTNNSLLQSINSSLVSLKTLHLAQAPFNGVTQNANLQAQQQLQRLQQLLQQQTVQNINNNQAQRTAVLPSNILQSLAIFNQLNKIFNQNPILAQQNPTLLNNLSPINTTVNAINNLSRQAQIVIQTTQSLIESNLKTSQQTNQVAINATNNNIVASINSQNISVLADKMQVAQMQAAQDPSKNNSVQNNNIVESQRQALDSRPQQQTQNYNQTAKTANSAQKIAGGCTDRVCTCLQNASANQVVANNVMLRA